MELNRNKLYIFQNDKGDIYAYTTDSGMVKDYIKTLLRNDASILITQLGIAIIFTTTENKNN